MHIGVKSLIVGRSGVRRFFNTVGMSTDAAKEQRKLHFLEVMMIVLDSAWNSDCFESCSHNSQS